jgi:hypothetical protein
VIVKSSVFAAARAYVRQSPPWLIFPVDPGTKRPAIKTGRDHAEHATKKHKVLRGWYERGLLVAIGMPSGAASGTVVIDVDAKHDGEARLAELEAVLGPLPRDRVARTRSGGLHVYLAHPGDGIRVRTAAGAKSPLGRLLCGAPGVDVRADGGIVVLPPSKGVTERGKRWSYRWIAEGSLPPLPPPWLAAIQGVGDPPPTRMTSPHRSGGQRWSDPERGEVLGEGDRNDALYRRGVALHFAGATDAEILDDLHLVNEARCTPLLAADEIVSIAASAARATGNPAWRPV